MRTKWATTAGVVFASLVLSGGPAMASPVAEDDTQAISAASGPPSGAPCSVGAGAIACFEALGDKFWVKDKKQDGHHAVAGWSKGHDDPFGYRCHNYNPGWAYCEWADDIPEHSTIWFSAQVFEGDNPVFEGWGPVVSAKTT